MSLRMPPEEEQNMLGCIIGSIAIAALGLAMLQAAPKFAAAYPIYRALGDGVGLLIWLSAITVLVVGLWRHFDARKQTKITRRDAAFYAAMSTVVAVLIFALLWFAGLACLRAFSAAATPISTA